MKLIWKIFVRDVRQATRNVIAVIVAMGLVIVPALYAWYNIAADLPVPLPPVAPSAQPPPT